MFSDNFIRSLSNRFWSLVGAAATLGIVTGFTVPLASSYQSQKFYQPPPPDAAQLNSEMARLATRNRRLEALVETLRKRSATFQAGNRASH